MFRPLRRPARAAILAVLPLLVAASAPAAAAPAAFDWRDVGGVNLVSSVKNQQGCSSCWIFSGVAMVESRWMIQLHRAGFGRHEIDLSEQYIMDCGTGYFGDFECFAGGFIQDVSVHLRDVGAPFEDCYLYAAADGTCPATTCPDSGEPLVLHRPVQSAAFNSTYVGDAALMDEIYANGPVATEMEVYSDFYSYMGGVYEQITGTSAGRKGVLIVGWGEEAGTPYWICKNTWGTGWGEDGYFRIRRGVNECSIGQRTYTVEVAADVTATPGAAPAARILAQNVPNPFNPATEIVYAPPVSGRATLAVYDVAGRRVDVLADGDHEARREYVVTWHGRDGSGRRLPSGLYFYRLDWPGGRETRRMVLMK